MTTLSAILILLLVIITHELGHTLAAVATHVKVNKLIIGIPLPWIPVFRLFTIGGVEVALAHLPFGGGLDIDDYFFDSLPFGTKVINLLAGPFANFFVALSTASLILGKAGVSLSFELFKASFVSLYLLVTGQIDLSLVSGPIGIVALTDKLMQVDLFPAMFLVWLTLNVCLGAVNLLPIPLFDGGRILTSVLTKVSNNNQHIVLGVQKANSLTFSFLICISVLLLIKDIVNLFPK